MNQSNILEIFDIFYNNADERIRDKPLMGSPCTIISIYSFYVIFIVKVLPIFMANRKSFNYNKLMSCLDIILIIRSAYFLTIAIYGWFFFFDWTCQPIDRSGSWKSKLELKVSYEFVATKFIYTLQSVIFVLCKKKTGVHYYLLTHHSIFPIMLWFGLNYYPGGHATFIGFINSFVHLNVIILRLVVNNFPKNPLKRYHRKIHVGLHVSFIIR